METIITFATILYIVCVICFIIGVISLINEQIKSVLIKTLVFIIILLGIFAMIPYKIYRAIVYSFC